MLLSMGHPMGAEMALQKKEVRLELLQTSGTPQQILHGAIQLFADHGFDHVTVRDIAERAQVNHAAISYYFGTKEQLIRHAIATVIAPLNAQRIAALDAVKALEARGSSSSKPWCAPWSSRPWLHACKERVCSVTTPAC